MYDGCFKIDIKFEKKCKNIKYELCFKIDFNLQKIKLKIFNMMDVLK